MIEFRAWPKIKRLYRDIVITEKIDGTNGAIGIEEFPFGWHVGGPCNGECGYPDWETHDHGAPENATLIMGPLNADDGLPVFEYIVYAQSRSRIIAPGKTDNHGFAAWVYDNAEALVEILGVGLHFGEWWGSGINRGYGLKGERRFSLFNTSRWSAESFEIDHQCERIPPELGVVPILYQGEFSTLAVKATMEQLRTGGSVAAPQFMKPEGCVVFHTASNVMFKATLENDEIPKAVAAAKKPRELTNVTLLEVSADYDSQYRRSDLSLAA
jgi:RNA ligase-like protein